MAAVAREEALTRQHQAELDLLNGIIGAWSVYDKQDALARVVHS